MGCLCVWIVFVQLSKTKKRDMWNLCGWSHRYGAFMVSLSESSYSTKMTLTWKKWKTKTNLASESAHVTHRPTCRSHPHSPLRRRHCRPRPMCADCELLPAKVVILLICTNLKLSSPDYVARSGKNSKSPCGNINSPPVHLTPFEFDWQLAHRRLIALDHCRMMTPQIRSLRTRSLILRVSFFCKLF